MSTADLVAQRGLRKWTDGGPKRTANEVIAGASNQTDSKLFLILMIELSWRKACKFKVQFFQVENFEGWASGFEEVS